MRKGTERYIYVIDTKDGRRVYKEHYDDALNYYMREGIKLYLRTKDLYPTMALALYKAG